MSLLFDTRDLCTNWTYMRIIIMFNELFACRSRLYLFTYVIKRMTDILDIYQINDFPFILLSVQFIEGKSII